MKRLDSCPRKDGFRMPAEFEEHAGTYIIWPERTDNYLIFSFLTPPLTPDIDFIQHIL